MTKFHKVPIRNFSRVSAGLYRGSAPDELGMEFVRGIGVKTIVDLRKQSISTRRECMRATQLGLHYFNIPTGYLCIPDAVIAAFLAISLHPRYQPVMVHCTDGLSRTAAMVALYRVAVEGWHFDWAYKEMRDKRFQPCQLFLRFAVQRFAQRMTPLNFQQRLCALQDLVEQHLFTV